ncbi:isochorismatase family cysteine hydrolase [Saccharothrix australiensis]|uniref:Nicotinamidase-related amidase n=1 Tax=Saccharothrix australiensis TaxID=2072 RepID=A0A495W8L3_9PSEU|nr:isochorismatase family cysteine hydrolase [Saccharothrix australiensis]RKT56993.1 nicotinamidase-related amidase [Saccharothrix australiensis]
MVTALVIVDVQEALVPLVWRGDELVDRISALARRARRHGAPVVALRQVGPAGSAFDPDHPGTRLSPRLGLGPGDVVIDKTATDAFYRTDLAAVLAARAVDTVVLTGLATDYCVDATARSALSHGLDVVLVADGHAPAADGDPEAGLTPERIVDRHNRILGRAVHPGGVLRVRPAAEVVFPDRS